MNALTQALFVSTNQFIRSWRKPAVLISAQVSLFFMNVSYAEVRLEPGQLKAANIARMVAEMINGGLSNYHPARCMYQQGGAECMVESGSQGFRFLFLGGKPGWQELRLPPSIETELFIGNDGSKAVIYNGPLR